MKFSKIKIPICFVFRVEGFVFSHVADEGWIDSCAGELLRYAQCTLSVYERIYRVYLKGLNTKFSVINNLFNE